MRLLRCSGSSVVLDGTDAATAVTMTTHTPLTAPTMVRITKGCRARGIAKNCNAVVREVTPLGADYSHQVKVVLVMSSGINASRVFAFYARHPNRLADDEIRLNDGNPLHTISIRRV